MAGRLTYEQGCKYIIFMKCLFEGKVLQRTNRPKYTGWENGWNESFGPKTWPLKFGVIFGGWPKFCVDGWLWWLTPQTPNLRRPQRKTPSLEAKRGIFRLERPVSPIFPLCIMLNKSEDEKIICKTLPSIQEHCRHHYITFKRVQCAPNRRIKFWSTATFCMRQNWAQSTGQFWHE